VEGLHLAQKCFTCRTEHGIRVLVDVLGPELSQLYCVTHSDFLEYFSPDGKTLSDEECEKLNEQHTQFLLEEFASGGRAVADLKLFDRGFLLRFRNYLWGDWTDFYLLSTRIPLSAIQPWGNQVPPECQIFISCVDAAYWEVFARDTSLLARIKEHFPDAVPFELENKTV
jgi:hypothetical protein